LGITVRTKWQSSPISGDRVGKALKGNRQNGDILIVLREILLDLSRKVYSIHYHLLKLHIEMYNL